MLPCAVKMKNKKAVEIHYMILLAIGAFTLLVLMIMVPRLLGKGSGETRGYLDDYDSDGVVNSLDKCACDSGDEDNNGCPTTGPYKDGYIDAAKREECKKKIA